MWDKSKFKTDRNSAHNISEKFTKIHLPNWKFICCGLLGSDIYLTLKFIIPSASTKLKGGYTGFTLSVRLSVGLSVCGQNRVRSVSSTILVESFHICTNVICNFGQFFKFVTLTLSSFDLGSNMTQYLSWGGGGYPQNAGVLVVLVLFTALKYMCAPEQNALEMIFWMHFLNEIFQFQFHWNMFLIWW